MNFTQLLHRNVQQRPNQDAIIFNGQSWTYQQMAERVARLAGALQALGISPSDRVSMLSLNSNRYVEYLFAVPWAGGAINPVNTRWSAAEVAYSLVDSETKILVVDDNFVSDAGTIKEQTPGLQQVIYAGDGDCPDDMLSYERLIENTQPVEDVYRNGDDLFGVFYTGGTTGSPKGVMQSHASMMVFPLTGAMMTGMTQEPRMLHCAPLFHIAGYGIMLISFIMGGTQVVLPSFNPADVSSAVREHSVTDMLLIPTMVQLLLDSPGFDPANFTSLQHIIYGASPMPLGTMDKAMESMPHVGFVHAYGMTECGLITVASADNHTTQTRESGRIRSAGLAGPVQEVRIVDENNAPLPTGSVGEIVMRGPNAMLGYWQKSEVTEKTIVDGWLHTGDGGYLDEAGYLFVVDRVKDMIISGGENVYSAEVEAIITQHPAVSQCAVIGIPSDEWGEAVHAVIVPAPGTERADDVTVENLRDFCREHIAGYKCPRSLELVNALPMSGAGKILKTELRKPYWQNRDQQVS